MRKDHSNPAVIKRPYSNGRHTKVLTQKHIIMRGWRTLQRNVAKETEADNMKSVLWYADRVMIKREPQVG